MTLIPNYNSPRTPLTRAQVEQRILISLSQHGPSGITLKALANKTGHSETRVRMALINHAYAVRKCKVLNWNGADLYALRTAPETWQENLATLLSRWWQRVIGPPNGVE